MAQLWGGRFTKATDQLVYNFNASITFDQKFYKQDIEGSIAHVKMLGKQGILTEQEMNDIITTLQEIKEDVESGKLEITSEYDVFMIYLIDEQGNIVWSFQPMEDYDNLYALKGIQGKDLDGDGFKDLVVFAKYSYEGDLGELLVDTVCTVYYQRTAGFEKDKDFTANYECTEEDTLEALVGKIRAYWGWQT